MENTAIVPVPSATLAPKTTRAILFADALKEEAEQRNLLGQYVKQQMTAGTDYGVIPGTQKPTLLKPGAEKLVEIYRCSADYECVSKVENWETGLFAYEFKVRIIHRDSGTVVATGVGSCNTREGRYRWRQGERKCPNCGKSTIIKGKADYGGGWLCFAKKGGCGAKWPDGARDIEGQDVGKVENDDVFTYTNTVLKMAKKRALVDAAIALARCSDIFTQDVEDFGPGDQQQTYESPQSQQGQPPSSNQQEPQRDEQGHRILSEQDIKEISPEEAQLITRFSKAETEDERKAVLADMKQALPKLGGNAATRLSTANLDAQKRIRAKAA